MNSDTAATGFIMALCAIALIVAAMMLATPAKGGAVCLTKKEARELWPRRHIYWYSKDHCWSNRRGPPRGIRIDPVKAKALASEAKAEQDYCCWPKLPRDSAGAIIEPPPSFKERWNEVLDVFKGAWKRLTE